MAKSGIMTKRIPTLLGLFILGGGLIAGVVLVNMRQGFGIQAGPTESPKNIKISNLGSSSFSVSWTTDTPLTGYIKYSDNLSNINLPAGDVRDQISGTSQSYTNHLVNIVGLSPKTYYFVIGSGSKTYDDNGKPFQVRTTNQVVSPPEDIIFGKVVGVSANPVNGAIVNVEVEGGESLSAMTKSDGTWRLNLANSRDQEGKVLTYDQEKALLSIFVPDIILGQNQSFIEGVPVTGGEGVATGSAATNAGFQSQLASTITDQSEATSSVKILNPAVNGEIIATSSPEIRGRGKADSTIKITLNSPTEYVVSVKVAADGTWSWTPPQKLDPGAHTLVVEYTDENNVVQKVTRTFTVLAADLSTGLPAFTATQSATPIITPTATPSAATPMPTTDSDELTDAGGLQTTIGLAILGLILLLIGKGSKKWLKN
jgi:hypothetical protein